MPGAPDGSRGRVPGPAARAERPPSTSAHLCANQSVSWAPTFDSCTDAHRTKPVGSRPTADPRRRRASGAARRVRARPAVALDRGQVVVVVDGRRVHAGERGSHQFAGGARGSSPSSTSSCGPARRECHGHGTGRAPRRRRAVDRVQRRSAGAPSMQARPVSARPGWTSAPRGRRRRRRGPRRPSQTQRSLSLQPQLVSLTAKFVGASFDVQHTRDLLAAQFCGVDLRILSCGARRPGRSCPTASTCPDKHCVAAAARACVLGCVGPARQLPAV